jgi:hypothetical protein
MGLGIGGYTQHAAFLPRRRCHAGASRTCHPGRYAALPSPDPIHNFRSYLGLTVAEKEAVVAAVQAWLSEMVADALTGNDDSDNLSNK